MKEYRDLHELPEDDRIADIASAAMMGGLIAVCVDQDPPDKIERYKRKLIERFPELEIVDQFAGPVRGVLTFRVRRRAPGPRVAGQWLPADPAGIAIILDQIAIILDQIKRTARPAAAVPKKLGLTVAQRAELSSAFRNETGRAVPVLELDEIGDALAVLDLDGPESRELLRRQGIDPDNLQIMPIHGADQ